MNLVLIYKDQFRFNIFSENTEFITDGKIPNKNGNFRKRSEETQTVSVSDSEFFYRFRFRIFGNRFRFRLDLNFGKISKTISGIRKLPFPFSSLNPPLASMWAPRHSAVPCRSPRCWASWAASRARALGGPKSPSRAQQGRKSFFFLFSHFFSHFSHIELYANILCTKNSSNKIIGHKNNKI
jgi:hypothetical protein